MTQTLHDFTVRTNAGEEKSLSEYRGKTVLVVNTASGCGFTRQYEGLQALHKKYSARGFAVLAFPANNFMGQEPGTDGEIRDFCSTKYKVTFPLFAKISVKGGEIAPLYAWLTHEGAHQGVIAWNFAKFLVGPTGEVAERFDPAVEPLDPEVVAAIEKLLGI